jgi:hypothetical protein
MSALESEILTDEMMEEDTIDVSDIELFSSVNTSDEYYTLSESEFKLSEIFIN